MTNNTNTRIVLANHLEGSPSIELFRTEQVPMTSPASGQVLLRSRFLSIDPYVRNRLTNAKSYAKGVGLGEVIVGETVAEVLESRHANFKPGQLVKSWLGWQSHGVADGDQLQLLPDNSILPSLWLGVLGMPGLTAYTGLLDIGRPKPGETVVVPAAAGPVGSAVGQIARLHGARAVGIAGGAAKCRSLMDDYGFDAAVDHRAPDFAAQLAAACPKGIDVFFDSVGGAVLSAVLPLLNDFSRIPLCGTIADYASAVGMPDQRPALMRTILVKRVTVRGFIVYDFAHREPDFQHDMKRWLAERAITYREDIAQGLAQAPDLFVRLLEGKTTGKAIVQLD